MRKSATSLYELLENLLEWSSMQIGVNPFSPSSCELHKIIDENLVLVTEVAADKKIKILESIPENFVVHTDKNMLSSIVRNLISNSIKFTPEGGEITISVAALDTGFAEISISDTGIGMNQEILNNLFVPDIKINRKGTNNESSSGLGLMICKEFVEKNGGILRVESEEGKGATFSFTIPLQGH